VDEDAGVVVEAWEESAVVAAAADRRVHGRWVPF